MRVAFDWGPLLDPLTGVGRYAQSLGAALEAQGVQLVRYAIAFGGSVPQDVEIRRWRIPARMIQTAWRRFGRPPIERLTGEIDCVHATNFVLPPTRVARGLVTIHDLSYERDDAFPGAHRLRDLVGWSVERAAGVIVPSHAIGTEVTQRYRLGEDRVFVIPEGVGPHLFGATPLGDETLVRLGLARPFVLAVGTRAPRKNLSRLMEAWKRAKLDDWTLVLAGGKGWGPELDHPERVVDIGRVDESTLPGLLAAAEIFCYPSLYEGFGLPPLEAMAAGTAVVAGAYSAAGEVLGDSALLVEPEDVLALASALRELATNDALRRSYAVAGRAQAASYTWEGTAKATIRAYRLVSGAGSSPP